MSQGLPNKSKKQDKAKQLYLGLMSGTSADGIDLALVDFTAGKPLLVSSFYQAYNEQIRAQITALYQPGNNEIERAFALDVLLAKNFARAIKLFLQQQALSSDDIVAIGNHGQTIRHRPNIDNAFTLQIGCNQTLATLSNIKVIGQFRHKDIALGGQGAPLVPAFHQTIFSSATGDVFVVNIGGIANVTYLPQDKNKAILGFDTGPGNALLDDWYAKHNKGYFDLDGNWGAQGKVSKDLLTKMLSDHYFQQKAPKSTGREVFNLSWLSQQLSAKVISASDVQATLLALTTASITDAIKGLSSQSKVYLCGGGIHNKALYQQLIDKLPQHHVMLTNNQGVDADALESIAFAWLAYRFENNLSSNIPAVTGASRSAVLGSAFFP